jgi:hypothetical protein
MTSETTTKTRRINLHDPINEICDRLGVNVRLVNQINITPSYAVVVSYKPNEDGKPFIDENGDVPQILEQFQIFHIQS